MVQRSDFFSFLVKKVKYDSLSFSSMVRTRDIVCSTHPTTPVHQPHPDGGGGVSLAHMNQTEMGDFLRTWAVCVGGRGPLEKYKTEELSYTFVSHEKPTHPQLFDQPRSRGWTAGAVVDRRGRAGPQEDSGKYKLKCGKGGRLVHPAPCTVVHSPP